MLTEQLERYRNGSLWKVEGALCDDGKQRTATATAHADTFFSIPARVKARGKTVTGFMSADDVCQRCGISHVDHDYRTDDGGWNFGAGKCADGAPMGEVKRTVRFTAYRYGKNAGALARREDG